MSKIRYRANSNNCHVIRFLLQNNFFHCAKIPDKKKLTRLVFIFTFCKRRYYFTGFPFAFEFPCFPDFSDTTPTPLSRGGLENDQNLALYVVLALISTTAE